MQAHAQGSGYWHTEGNQVVDSNGTSVRLAGVNWYGFETTDFIAHGLWAQNYKSVLNTIKARGYNVVRVPFSNQMVESNPVPTNFNKADNADLVNQTALQDMDSIVAYAGSIGLRVILDNHRSEAGNTNEANGLWYTGAYPESNWIADWKAIATRYSASRFTFAGNPTVIGMDLRNEPHLQANGGNTGSCWTGDTSVSGGCPTSLTSQNWPVAATKAANAILAINSNLLIFVEGNDCYGGDCAWEGENLLGVAQHPLVLQVANRLVYSAHDYGPELYRQPWFTGNTSQASLNAVWNKYWGYISAAGTAPVWLGEFGTGNNPADASDTAAGSQGQWFSGLVTYLKTNPSIQWTYWALNGEDSYGLLDNSYDSTPASATKQSLLATIQSPLSNGAPAPSFTLAPSSSTVSLKQGQSATETVSVADFGGFNGSVKLAASSLPMGVTASFAPNPTATSSVLTLTAGGAATTGPASVTISGSSGALTAATSIALNVTASAGGGGGGSDGAKCAVHYSVTPYNSNAFGGSLTISNTGSTTFGDWTLVWSFANGQSISSLWNGTESQSGATVTVHSLNYNGNLPAGASYNGVGFNGNWNGSSNATPKTFSLNGIACSIQ